MEPVRLGRFRLEQRIGRGGMAEVWRGHHVDNEHPVAIKVMGVPESDGALWRERMVDEIRAVAQLNHPGIVQVYDAGRLTDEVCTRLGRPFERGGLYMVMELAEGTLIDLQDQALTWTEQKEILAQVLKALAHAHAQGVIHRDLKPENILWMADGYGLQTRLSDFGLADAFDDRRPTDDAASELLGTPQFMAPEQIEGRWRDQGPWTDLYSLGCLVYWLVGGQAPFAGMTPQAVLEAQRSRPPASLSPQMPVPANFGPWLRRLMAKSIDDRYRCAADALADLEAMVFDAAISRGTEAIGGAGTEEFITLGATTWQEDGLAPPDQPRGSSLNRDWREGARAVKFKRLPGVGLGLFEVRQLPLVGRQDIRDQLWQRLQRLTDEQAHLGVVLRGQRGVGVTRLGQWLVKRAHEEAGLFVMAATHEPNVSGAAALSSLFGQALGLTGLGHEELLERLHQLRDQGTLEGISNYDCHALAQAFAADIHRPPTGGSMTTVMTIDQMLRAMGNALSALGRHRPMVLLLDDIQWGGETLRLVELLLEDEAVPAGLLVVMTEQIDSDPVGEAKAAIASIVSAGLAEAIDVGPMKREEHRQLVRQLLGLAPELTEQVVELTEGSPQFAVELVGHWIDEDKLEGRPGGFVLVSDEPQEVPETSQGVLQERLTRVLDELEAQAIDVEAIEVAAVLGMEFNADEWSAVCMDSGWQGTEAALHYLVRTKVLRRREKGWRFGHGRLREVVLERAQRGGRLRDHHRRCARALSEYHGIHRHEAVGRIAYHYMEAQAYDEALQPLLKAAQYACDTSRWERLGRRVNAYQHCLDQMGAGPEDLRRVRAWVISIKAYGRRGELHRARPWIEKCRRIARRENDRAMVARVDFHRAWFLHHEGHPEESAALCREIVEVFEAVDDALHQALALYLWSINIAWTGGTPDEEIKYSGRALELFEELGDDPGRARCLLSLGVSYCDMNQREKGLALLNQALQLYETMGDRYAMALTLGNLGKVYRRMGDLEASERMLRRGFKSIKEVGSTDVGVSLNLACTLIDRGETDEARAVVEELIEELEASERGGFLGICYATLLPCHGADGDWERWDESMALSAAYLRDNAIVEEEVALTFERGARRAEQGGQLERAYNAWEKARRQWMAIGDEDEIERVEAAMQSLV